jgi:hypothetical protein
MMKKLSINYGWEEYNTIKARNRKTNATESHIQNVKNS